MQSYLHELLQEHHTFARDVKVVQDNAKVLTNDSSSSMLFLLQQQDNDNWAAKLTNASIDGMMEPQDNTGISRWENQEPSPSSRQRNNNKKLPNDKLFKKKKNESSVQKKKSKESSSTSAKNKMIPFAKQSIRRSISDSKNMQDTLRKRAMELLLATSGTFTAGSKEGGGGGDFAKKGMIRRNSWSHQKLHQSRDWEEFSGSHELTIPVRRTSGEMSEEFKWDDGDAVAGVASTTSISEQQQRQHKSLEFTNHSLRQPDEQGINNNVDPTKYKDTRLKVPTRRNTFQDTPLFDEDEDSFTDGDTADADLSSSPPPSSTINSWYHHRQKKSTAASHIQEASDITAM
ncbi:unnamed protein product [Cylindrotheca closterium]|uniref:Uncharacterized protein n=1 Tax=Cylindrotheca closterium TaxID=2856 RepID=A0AAD2CNH7_9STRA|nr:unnamed protein product [Cylindrotheca closterium]